MSITQNSGNVNITANTVGIEATELKLKYNLNHQNYQIGWVPEVLKYKMTGTRSCMYSAIFLVKHNALTGTYDMTPFYYLHPDRGYLPADVFSLNCKNITHYQNLTESVYVVQLVDKCIRGTWLSPENVQFSLFLPTNVSVHKGTSTTYDYFELMLCKVARVANTELLYKQFKYTSLNSILSSYRRRVEDMTAFDEWCVSNRSSRSEKFMEQYSRYRAEKDRR